MNMIEIDQFNKNIKSSIMSTFYAHSKNSKRYAQSIKLNTINTLDFL